MKKSIHLAITLASILASIGGLGICFVFCGQAIGGALLFVFAWPIFVACSMNLNAWSTLADVVIIGGWIFSWVFWFVVFLGLARVLRDDGIDYTEEEFLDILKK